MSADASAAASASRPLTTTPAPSSASSAATARPMPRDPPTTTAPRPVSGALIAVLDELHHVHVPVAAQVGEQTGVVDLVGEDAPHGARRAVVERELRSTRMWAISSGELDGNVSSHVIVMVVEADAARRRTPRRRPCRARRCRRGWCTAGPIGSSMTTSSAISASQPSLSLACTQRHEACEAASAGDCSIVSCDMAVRSTGRRRCSGSRRGCCGPPACPGSPR